MVQVLYISGLVNNVANAHVSHICYDIHVLKRILQQVLKISNVYQKVINKNSQCRVHTFRYKLLIFKLNLLNI